MTPAAREVLAEIGARRVAALAPLLQPRIRLELRDQAVRDVLAEFFSGMRKTPAAFAMSLEMATHAGGTPRADKLAMIVALSLGRPLSARRIIDIGDGRAEKCRDSALFHLSGLGA